MQTCQCSDKGCRAHINVPLCRNEATTTLYRIDMEDHTGTPFCEDCADDAFESGLFTDELEEDTEA